MNRFFALPAAVLLTAVLLVRAQDQAPAGGENLKAKLGLSDDQAKKLKEALKAKQEAVRPLRQQLREHTGKLREQIKGHADDPDIQTTLDALSDAQLGLQAENEKFRSAANSFLTATQRGKLYLWMAEQAKHPQKKEGGKKGGAPIPAGESKGGDGGSGDSDQ